MTANIGTPQQHEIKDLKIYHQNPRVGDVEAIAQSLQVNGAYKPIVVNRGTHTGRPNEVLAGNHTLKAHRLLVERGDSQWATIATWVVDVDDEQAARIVLADNRTADLGSYDNDDLLELLGSLDDGLEGTGYDEGYIDALLGANIPDEGMAALDGDSEYLDEEEAAADGADFDTPPATPAVDKGGLVRRFIQPPFTVIDTRKGEWRDRKRQWVALGVNSGDGRDEELTFTSAIGKYGNWYDIRAKAKAADPNITDQQIEEQYADELKPYGNGSGTSEFDPALAELLITWFSAPGHLVLDPWAGGSVRGIVSAALGRAYTGYELRPEQVQANKEQWDTVQHLIANNGTGDYTPEYTPVETHDGYLVKRDDAWSYRGAYGAKARTMIRLLDGKPGLITAGSRISPQMECGALSAAALGLPCRIHTGSGSTTPEIDTCLAAGADVQQHQPARLSVIKKRFRDDAAAHPEWLTIPAGMDMQEYVDDVAKQVTNLPPETTRIVTPVGSGTTTAGIIQGLINTGRTDITILGVSVGGDPTEHLDKFAPEWRNHLTLVDAHQPYEEQAPTSTLGDLTLDPHYEAKCLPFLEPGDLLWTVGIRTNASPNTPNGTAQLRNHAEVTNPQWITGDSATAMQATQPLKANMIIGCPPYYDLEEYSDNPDDLSNMTAEQFDAAMLETLQQADRHLQDNSYAVFIVGNVRNKHGNLQDMKTLMQRCAQQIGWNYTNDAVLINAAGSAAMRASGPFTKSRTLARVHQDIIIFTKGDRKAAAAKCGEVQVKQLAADNQPEE